MCARKLAHGFQPKPKPDSRKSAKKFVSAPERPHEPVRVKPKSASSRNDTFGFSDGSPGSARFDSMSCPNWHNTSSSSMKSMWVRAGRCRPRLRPRWHARDARRGVGRGRVWRDGCATRSGGVQGCTPGTGTSYETWHTRVSRRLSSRLFSRFHLFVGCADPRPAR